MDTHQIAKLAEKIHKAIMAVPPVKLGVLSRSFNLSELGAPEAIDAALVQLNASEQDARATWSRGEWGKFTGTGPLSVYITRKLDLR